MSDNAILIVELLVVLILFVAILCFFLFAPKTHKKSNEPGETDSGKKGEKQKK